ncbi:hypothetical protein GCT13_30840 [Paraburkholderia sp. CNPSo 3157]|uniref:Uncharacterized protein n=1 Tax=Paraburkholderia franconis TaxID=2654983 RepID=A0A7X1NFT6_9BURK|nr:hypothetical protein [Paraburkholderia franconis]MPW21157.1 hypothetical protein [Paraburkholderia franconis]
MKDAFERRALLLHLGDALHAIDVALAADATRHTVRDLLNAHADLAAHAWLAAVSPATTAADFAKQASASFAAWPAQLLEEQVDYAQLALAVRDNLFAGNAAGWRAYVDAMKREVEWFGDALPAHAEPTAQTFESADADVPSADAADVERAEEPGEPQRESVESNGRLYPSWPWKPGV